MAADNVEIAKEAAADHAIQSAQRAGNLALVERDNGLDLARRGVVEAEDRLSASRAALTRLEEQAAESSYPIDGLRRNVANAIDGVVKEELFKPMMERAERLREQLEAERAKPWFLESLLDPYGDERRQINRYLQLVVFINEFDGKISQHPALGVWRKFHEELSKNAEAKAPL